VSEAPAANDLVVRRSLVSWFLHALFAPGRAQIARLAQDRVLLHAGSRTETVLLHDVVSVSEEPGIVWRGLSIEVRGGRRHRISGLPDGDATRFAHAVAAAREETARGVLAARADALAAAAILLREMRAPPRYVRLSAFGAWLELVEQCLVDLPARPPSAPDMQDAVRILEDVQDAVRDPRSFRAAANQAYVRDELDRMRTFLDHVESKPLTSDQRRAVVVDEDRNLVVAAAGSGKTSVIVAKVAHLVQRELCPPGAILMLAFAKDAAGEMRERVEKRIPGDAGRAVTVSTFHALGLSIIGKAEDRRPSIAREAEDQRQMAKMVKAAVAASMTDDRFATRMKTWFRSHFAPYRSQLEFKTQGEYIAYIREHEIRSLKGDQVRSYEECEIANFLFLNCVDYEYERKYEHDTATAERSQYRPDFYLPGAGIYIEHFAVDRQGRAPEIVGGPAYVADMQWKRDLHAQHGTRLIETHSYEKSEGCLVENLRDKLVAAGVALRERPWGEVFKLLEELGRVDRLTKLVMTFAYHFKSSGLSFADIRSRARAARNAGRAEAYVDVFEAIFEQYQADLRRREEIDFEDMILRATEHVESGRYTSPYSYLLVDEFQDISRSRARLVRALLAQNPSAQLFAVGDDWQSIYRFAGADVSIMREFGEYFGTTERTDLGETFRCADRVCDVATRFVTQNPAQIRKDVRAVRRAPSTRVHVGFAAENGGDAVVREALASIAQSSGESDRTSVMVLGRYRHSEPGNLAQLQREFVRLDVSFMTIHASKGQEADWVVIVDLQAGRRGFPSAAQDDPLLDLVLARAEPFQHAEERRLFYVALTRARHGAYLVATGGRPSAFVTELLKGGYDVTTFGTPPKDAPDCPSCVTAKLAIRDGPYGRFWGCENYPLCEFKDETCRRCNAGLMQRAAGTTQVRCSACGLEERVCPGCGTGRIVERAGPWGRFFGCSSYPRCEYKERVSGGGPRAGPDRS
jgi:DNA helicase-4